MGDAFDSICQHLLGLKVTFFTKVSSQIAHKMQDFGYPPSTGFEMLCCEDRQQVLLRCFISNIPKM